MRIVFFGTPEFAVPSLRTLLSGPDHRISRLKRDIYRRRVKKWIKEGIPLEDKNPTVHI